LFKVVKLTEALPSYKEKDWIRLETDILSYYDAELTETGYKVHNIQSLTQYWRHNCEFMTIAGWFLNKKKINETQQAAYFWHRIHSGLREIIEQRLSAKNPLHDITQVFPMTDVINTVQASLERNRFDYDLMDSDSEELSDESSESDSEDNSSENSDSESESEVDHNKSSHKKKSHKKKAKSYKAKSSKEDHTKKQTSKDTGYTQHKNSQEEVENLIKQLGKMSVNDPQYALSYYKAVKLDSLAAKCLRPPQVGGYSPPSHKHPFMGGLVLGGLVL
jgi:Mg-chelatase subunit ChlI